MRTIDSVETHSKLARPNLVGLDVGKSEDAIDVPSGGIMNLVHAAQAFESLIGPLGLVCDCEKLGAFLRREEQRVSINKLEALMQTFRKGSDKRCAPFHSMGL